MSDDRQFDPLNKLHLAESVARALLLSRVHPVAPLTFEGAGIYAIYYAGSHPAYQRLAQLNLDASRWPIYVGSAVPEGGRKGIVSEKRTRRLAGRLKKHAESIACATNLELDDFRCRFLVVDPFWIPLAESLLIERFAPVWNRVLDGFGNHDPGQRRAAQQRSPWDTVHPGRRWATKLAPNPASPNALEQRAVDYLAQPDSLPDLKDLADDTGASLI